MNKRSAIRDPQSKILIAGGGPAGTSLAIRLALQDIPVILIERERFPRQKLCGEFVSPECFAHFRDLGVYHNMINETSEMISETRFYERGGKSVVVPSSWFAGDGAALGLSRAEMDNRLMNRAKALGVDVREEANISSLCFDSFDYCEAEIRASDGNSETIQAAFLVDATGRSRALSKLAIRCTNNVKSRNPYQAARLVGFKTHLRNTNLENGACEIYSFPGGYGGLNYVEGGLANHCFLVKGDVVKRRGSADAILEKAVFQNKRAFEMLRDAEPVREWLRVAVNSFGVADLTPRPRLFTVGDSAAFIDPFTGSGMLMAFESSELLTKCLVGNLSSPGEVASQYRNLYRKMFSRRLYICTLLRHAAFYPNLARAIIAVLSRQNKLRAWLARSTRYNT